MLKKIYNIRLFIYFSLFIFFIVFYQYQFLDDIFLYTLLLPVSYLIISFLEHKTVFRRTLIFHIFNIFSFTKYFLMPLIIISSGSIDVYGPSPTISSYKIAIVILVLECLFVNFIKIKYYKKKIYLLPNSYNKSVSSINVLIVLLILIYLIVFQFSILTPINIFQDYDFENTYDKITSNYALVLFNLFKIIGFPILVLVFNKFLRQSKAYYLSIILMCLFIYLNLGRSRLSILFFLILGLNFLYAMYGKKALKLAYPFAIVGVFIFLSISIYKFSWLLQDSNDKYFDILKVLSSQFQPYFSGPSLLAQTIDMHNLYKFNESIGIETFFNDIMGSVPILSNHINQYDRINYYFNEYIFGYKTIDTSQIIPMSGIGYIYFGFLLSPILTMFFTWLGFKLETLAIQSKHIINSYLLYYMSIWSVLAICFSLQIIWGNFINSFIPLLFIQFFINKIKLK